MHGDVEEFLQNCSRIPKEKRSLGRSRRIRENSVKIDSK
jgi:hypothetical protein